MSVMWPDPFRSFLVLDLTDSAHLSPSTCWRPVFQFNAFPASTDSQRWKLLTHFIYWNKRIRSKTIFWHKGLVLSLTCLTCCHFLEGKSCLWDRITVRRKTGEQQRGGYNKDKGPFRSCRQEALRGWRWSKLPSESLLHCGTWMCEQCAPLWSRMCVVSAWWKCKKTLPFTLTETWDKETWGLHTVY